MLKSLEYSSIKGKTIQILSDVLNLCQTDDLHFRLAMEEVLQNVVSYAYTSDGPLHIDVEISDTAYQIVVVDHGCEFNPLEQDAPDLAAAIDDRPIGGLGIFLARQIFSSMKYNRIGDTNNLSLTFTRDEKTHLY